MLDSYLEKYRANSRVVEVADSTDDELGPFRLLAGTWKNTERLNGRGWNMIAVPFASGEGPLDYRLMVNQYNEVLKFSLVDKRVPNRGILKADPSVNDDQLVVALDYEQMIEQLIADDQPDSDLEGGPNLAIHHEPGLFLHMTKGPTELNIARLSTIPHGNSALGLGTFFETDQPAFIEDISGLPIGVSPDLENNPYLSPYKFYNENPFKGILAGVPNFPGFNPVRPNDLLKGLPQNVVKNTVLPFDTSLEQAGIHNIPFIEHQADASEMKATFWILELDGDGVDAPNLLLAYTQTVLLDFFPRRDGEEGLIRWPHVSINVMEKIAEADNMKPAMPTGY